MTQENCKVLDRMKQNDKLIAALLEPFEKSTGIRFNEFVKPDDPKFVEPSKKNSLKRKLAEAEKKQKKLKKLTPEEARHEHWRNAMQKARGIKVKDDPKLIKKAIKRKEDEKKRHKKKWAERVEKQQSIKKFKEEKKAKNRKNKGANKAGGKDKRVKKKKSK